MPYVGQGDFEALVFQLKELRSQRVKAVIMLRKDFFGCIPDKTTRNCIKIGSKEAWIEGFPAVVVADQRVCWYISTRPKKVSRDQWS